MVPLLGGAGEERHESFLCEPAREVSQRGLASLGQPFGAQRGGGFDGELAIRLAPDAGGDDGRTGEERKQDRSGGKGNAAVRKIDLDDIGVEGTVAEQGDHCPAS